MPKSVKSLAVLLPGFLFLHQLTLVLAEPSQVQHVTHKSTKHRRVRSLKSSCDEGYDANDRLVIPAKNLTSQPGVTRPGSSKGKVYNLTMNSFGNKFFDDWNFFSEADPTHGLVDYQTVDEAWSKGLVSVGPNSNDKSLITAKMKVDSTSWLAAGQLRNSVRLGSKKRFKYGLLVLDAIKMPFGCSTWPAFWTVGSNWPVDGEIDIVEGVNMLSTNQMTLHTGAGCSLANPMSQSAVGSVLKTDCDAYASGNEGCGVLDQSKESYGEAFNLRGGGVFAMEWASTGITIWRFNRGEVPKDLLSGNNPQPSSWTIQPSAHWANTQCNQMNDQFSEHQIVFDITLCGDWAGANGVFNANNACSGTCESYVRDPNNYLNADWVRRNTMWFDIIAPN